MNIDITPSIVTVPALTPTIEVPAMPTSLTAQVMTISTRTARTGDGFEVPQFEIESLMKKEDIVTVPTFETLENVRVETAVAYEAGVVLFSLARKGGVDLAPDYSALFGTVLDPRARTITVAVNGVDITLPTEKFNIIRVRKTQRVNNALQTGLFWGVRVASPAIRALNETIKYGNKKYPQSLLKALAQTATTAMNRMVMQRRTGRPALFWAWAHMSNIADNQLGLDWRVECRLIDCCLRKAVELGIDVTDLKRARKELHKGGYSTGYGIYVTRHPATFANSADSMSLQIVEAHAALMGVNQETAEARGGDFDWDTACAYLGLDENTLEGYLDHLRAALKDHKASVIPAHLPLAARKGTLTLQSVFFNGHFDTADTGYNTLVGGELKAFTGLFKAPFFWGLEGILLANATKEEILFCAGEIVALPEGNRQPDYPAVVSRLGKYTSNPTSLNYNSLALAVHHYGLSQLEEAIMDSAKQKVNPYTLFTEPQVGLDAKGVVMAGLRTGHVDFAAMEKEGFYTGAFQLAVKLAVAEVVSRKTGNLVPVYSIGKAMEATNPVFHALITCKRAWQSQDPGSILNLLRYSLDEIEEAFQGTHGATTTENRRSLRQMREPQGETVESTYNTGEFTGHGFDAIPTLEPGKYSLPVTIGVREDKNEENYIVVTHGGEDSPVGYFQIQKNPYAMVAGQKGMGYIITSHCGSHRYAGEYLQALDFSPYESLVNNITQRDDCTPDTAYNGASPLQLVRVSLPVKAAMIASEAFKNAEYKPLETAALAVREFFNSLPLIPTRTGAAYFGEFIWLDIPVKADSQVRPNFSAEVRRHAWRMLEARGFDARITAHAKRGERLAVTDPKTGMSRLQSWLPFGAVANKNRLSKMDSVFVKRRAFANPRPSVTPRGVDMSHLKEDNLVTTMCVMYVKSDRFGKTASDETYRTPDGDRAVETKTIYYKSVTAEEYVEWCETNADNPELLKLAEAQEQLVNGSITIPTYKIPQDLPGQSRDGRKLNQSYRPGHSQPTSDRFIVSFRNDLPQDHDVRTALHAKGNNRVMVVHTIDNEESLVKKEAFDSVLRIVNSQLDNPVDPTGAAPAEIVSRDRSVQAFRAQAHLAGKYAPVVEPVTVGAYGDLVGEMETRLVAEGKRADGRMYVYTLAGGRNGTPTVIQPYIVDGEHVTALAGYDDVMASCYEVESGSYGKVRMDGVPLDPHLRTLGGEGFHFTELEKADHALYAQSLRTVSKMLQQGI
jgi:hypothetical protein